MTNRIKYDSMQQHGQKRMNKALMPDGWQDDNMRNMSDNNSASHNAQVFSKPYSVSANDIDDFSNIENIPVHNYLGRVKGYRTEVRRKKKK